MGGSPRDYHGGAYFGFDVWSLGISSLIGAFFGFDVWPLMVFSLVFSALDLQLFLDNYEHFFDGQVLR